MIDFLSQYNLYEFIVFATSFALLVVAAIKFFDWLNQRFDLVETKRTKSQRQMDEVSKNVSLLLEQNQKQQEALQILLESDMCRTRAEITRIWQQHMKERTIDYFTLAYAQKQFECYEAEGGNSYVRGLMEEMESWEIVK